MRLRLGTVLFACAAASSAIGQQQGTNAPVVPQPGQLHIPPNTRVVEGTVTNAQGEPIPGAIVLLKDTKTLQIRSYIAQQNGTYRFYGLSGDVNYQLRAQTDQMTSPLKLLSVFDSHKVIKIDLKVKDKKKRDNS